MENITSLFSDTDTQRIFTSLLWVMGTGGFIWLIDNILKKLENRMEGTFVQQARNIAGGIRVYAAIFWIGVSVFLYMSFYLKKEFHEIPFLLQGITYILHSIGKLVVYTIWYIAYFASEPLFGKGAMNRPPNDTDIIVGLIVIVVYAIIRRAFFSQMNPLMWALVIALFMVVGTAITSNEKVGNALEQLVGKRPTWLGNDSVNTAPKPDVEAEKPVLDADEKRDIRAIEEKLMAAIKDFVAKEANDFERIRSVTDAETYSNALRKHTEIMQKTNAFRQIEEICDQVFRSGNYSEYEKTVIEELLRTELCPYVADFFSHDHICDSPHAN